MAVVGQDQSAATGSRMRGRRCAVGNSPRVVRASVSVRRHATPVVATAGGDQSEGAVHGGLTLAGLRSAAGRPPSRFATHPPPTVPPPAVAGSLARRSRRRVPPTPRKPFRRLSGVFGRGVGGPSGERLYCPVRRGSTRPSPHGQLTPDVPVPLEPRRYSPSRPSRFSPSHVSLTSASDPPIFRPL